MGNADALRMGRRRAKEIIARLMLNKVLVPMADDALAWVVSHRINSGHNMTGNTINSYVVGVFVRGRLAYMRGSWESIPGPLTHKVSYYRAGRMR